MGLEIYKKGNVIKRYYRYQHRTKDMEFIRVLKEPTKENNWMWEGELLNSPHKYDWVYYVYCVDEGNNENDSETFGWYDELATDDEVIVYQI